MTIRRWSGKPSPLAGLLLRGVLTSLLFCIACSGRVGGHPGASVERTAITRDALSCLTEGAVAALPQWDAGVSSYNTGDRVQDGGQPWTCIGSGGCPTQWEPGSIGTSDLWRSPPVCGIQPWSGAFVEYEVGDIVSYGGSLYQCRQKHTSQSDWTPPATPALWQPFDATGGTGTGSGDVTQVTPVVDCVAQTAPGVYSAVFGYDNTSGSTVVAPIGQTNEFTKPPPPAAAGRGQPIAFQPGQHDGAFVVDFDGNALTWTLGDQSVTASSSSTACTTTQGPDGPVVTIGGTPILLHPDPGAVLPGSIVTTESGANGLAAGALPGSFDVSGDGAATYAIPIWTPPARMGIGPALSLSYSSRAARQWLGMGWTLGGISIITRCSKTIAQDGDATPVAFDNNDAFCLDGQRLLPTGDPTTNGIVSLAPERDSFTKVLFDTGAPTFKVLQRDGVVATYGSTSASRLTGDRAVYTPDPTTGGAVPQVTQGTYAWGLDTLSDATGNNGMTVQWLTSTSSPALAPTSCYEIVPTHISYSSDTRGVTIEYEPDPNPTCKFISGFGVGSLSRVHQIDAIVAAGVVSTLPKRLRSYVMQYQQSPVTQRSWLHSLQQCDGSGNGTVPDVCTPPTTFDYEPGSNRFEQVPITVPSLTGSGQVIWTDLNGDGKDDALGVLGGQPGSVGGSYSLNNGAGFGPSTPLPVNVASHFGRPGATPVSINGTLHGLVQSGDYLGCGPQGGACPEKDSIDIAIVTVGIGTPSGDYINSKKVYDATTIANSARDPFFVGDLDGDGQMDLMATAGTGSQSWRFWQGGPTKPVFPPINMPIATTGSDPTISDFIAPVDGTGKTAFLFQAILPNGSKSPTLVAVTANYSTGQIASKQTTLPVSDVWSCVTKLPTDDEVCFFTGCPEIQHCDVDLNAFYYVFVDLNNDGNAEALQIPVTGTSGTGVDPTAWPKVAFNAGTQFTGLQQLPGTTTDLSYTFPLQRGYVRQPNGAMQVADVDGDDQPDILLTYAPPCPTGPVASGTPPCTNPPNLPPLSPNGTTAVHVYRSAGAGGVQANGALQDVSGNFIYGPITIVDFDGDGQVDFFATDANGTGHLYRHAGNKPDQLTGIHDGLGKDITIAYKPVGDPTVYTADASCQYPQSCTNRGMWVVSEHSVTADWDQGGKPQPLPSGQPSPQLVTNKFSYTYAGGRSDLQGRGWLGFASRTVVDEQTSATTTTNYINNEPPKSYGYPQAGLPQQTTTTALTVDSGSGMFVTRTSTTKYHYNVSLSLGGRGATALPDLTETIVQEARAPVTPPGSQGSTSTLSDTTTSYGYDAFNNLNARTTTWQSREKRVWKAQYDQNTAGGKYLLSLLRRIDETSTVPGQPPVTRSEGYHPDPNTGLVIDETLQPEGDASVKVTVHYDRNPFGQVTHVASTATDVLTGSPMTRESFVNYDGVGGIFPSSVANALGHTTRTVYHPGLGVLVFAQDPNGVTTHNHYDAFGRPRSRATDGEGTLSVSYQQGHPYIEGPGSVPGLYSIETDQVGGGHSIVTYNALGDEVVRGVRNHDGTNSYVETYYTTIAGQVKAVVRPHAFVSGIGIGTPIWTQFVYDNLERLVQTVLPDGNVVSTAYNQLATTSVDPKHNARTQIVDDQGRLVRVDEDSTPNATSDPTQLPPPSAISTSYAYGPFGVLNQMTVTPRSDNGAPRTLSAMHYDVLGRRFDLVDADTGETVTGYNAFGEPVTETDANGQTHILSRDAIGRVFADFSTQDGLASFQWDTALHGVGMLGSSISTDKVTTSYTYDPTSRPVATTTHVSGHDYTTTRKLDGFGRVTAIQYPAVGSSQFTATFGFDAVGGVSSVSGSDPNAPVTWGASAWESDGQLSLETFWVGGQTSRVHNAQRAWLTDIVTTTPTESIQKLHYDYDPNGNPKARSDALLGTSESFQHDFLDRLTAWGFSAGSSTWSTTAQYSDLGNIQSRTTAGPTSTSLNYSSYGSRDAAGGAAGGAGVHAVTTVNGGAYTYDPKGNQITAPSRKVTYASFDLPKSVTVGGKTTTFQYDADHTRVRKKGPDGSSTISIGGLYEKRTDALGNVTDVFFVTGSERLIGQVEWMEGSGGSITGRKVVYVHDDHLGSIESISGSGMTTQHLKYDPFGQRVDPLTPTKTVHAPADLTDGFTDQEHDDELGLINMQGRMYDPKIGRFLSADPLVAAGVPSQGSNRYSYVLNSPLSLVDPSGFDPRSVKVGQDDTLYPCPGTAPGSMPQCTAEGMKPTTGTRTNCVGDQCAAVSTSGSGGPTGTATKTADGTGTPTEGPAASSATIGIRGVLIVADALSGGRLGNAWNWLSNPFKPGRKVIDDIKDDAKEHWNAGIDAARRDPVGAAQGVLDKAQKAAMVAVVLDGLSGGPLLPGPGLVPVGPGSPPVVAPPLVLPAFLATKGGGSERQPWKPTREGTEKVMNHGRFGNFYKSKSDGLWWSRDNAGHGGSVWKVFSETGSGLEWTADADVFGDFIVGKHKGDTGLSIPWSELRGVAGF